MVSESCIMEFKECLKEYKEENSIYVKTDNIEFKGRSNKEMAYLMKRAEGRGWLSVRASATPVTWKIEV